MSKKQCTIDQVAQACDAEFEKLQGLSKDLVTRRIMSKDRFVALCKESGLSKSLFTEQIGQVRAAVHALLAEAKQAGHRPTEGEEVIESGTHRDRSQLQELRRQKREVDRKILAAVSTKDRNVLYGQLETLRNQITDLEIRLQGEGEGNGEDEESMQLSGVSDGAEREFAARMQDLRASLGVVDKVDAATCRRFGMNPDEERRRKQEMERRQRSDYYGRYY